MKSTLQRAGLTFAGFFFLCPVLAQSQGPATGTLKGVVTDQTGAAVDGILIRKENWGVDARQHPMIKGETSSYTDLEGRFSLTLAPGVYDVFISSSSFSPIAKRVDVKAGNETAYNPQLSLDPHIKLIP